MSEGRADLARALSQLRDLGIVDLYLNRVSRSDALELARGAPGRSPGAGARPATASEGPRQPPGQLEASGSGPLAPTDTRLSVLREQARTCTACRLSETRRTVVFSDGNPRAKLMVIGEAPGRHEDETGLPFVGQAGKMLDLMLRSIDLSREDSVYICNVIKCRPPANRNPLPDEISSCTPFLQGQIDEVRPRVALAVGSFAAQWLTQKPLALGKLRGAVYSYSGTPVVVTYHPAALLRNPGWTRAAWDDLQLLRQVMEG